MDADEFWTVVESARGSVDQLEDEGGELVAEALASRLAATSPQAILEFEAQFRKAHGALYRWDVWAAAYLIGGGCSDDMFSDFRAGVVALGRQWWQRVLANPDELADHPLVRRAAAEEDDDVIFAEPVGYAAAEAYERLTGDDCAFYEAWQASPYAAQEDAGDGEDMGERFDFDDNDEMRRRLPRLAALFAIDLDSEDAP
ncbi:MAG TPA: DUF4240 domain-containing protein [Micromonosporaceae bacterium]|nr:DUF4240 domain-containing protein [Micromonosporaceae bacterium]